MANPLDTLDPEEWFTAKAKQYGLTRNDLIHPADVDIDHAKGLRVLYIDKVHPRSADLTVEKVTEVETGLGKQPSARFAEWRNEGITLGLDRDQYDGGSKHVRFIPDDAKFTMESKEDAVNALRDFNSRSKLRPEQSIALAEPWDDAATALHDYWEDKRDQFDFIETNRALRMIVSHGIDGEDPLTGDDYFGRSITGHQKRARGEYKGNLAIVEENTGMDVSYGRVDPVTQ